MLRKFSSILIVLVMVLLLLSLATGCGGGSDGGGVFNGGVSTGTPEAIVRSMYSAVNDNDIDKFARCWIPEARDEIRNDITYEYIRSITVYNIQTSLISISGDRAVVYVEWDVREYGGPLEHDSETIDLERRGNEWLLSDSSPVDDYNLTRDEIQLAVTAYMTNVSHGDPVVTGSSERTLAICELLGPDELLREVPDGCRVANCKDIDGTAACGGCSNTNHYEWRLDGNGNVYSVCIGDDCDANGADHYQGVWP